MNWAWVGQNRAELGEARWPGSGQTWTRQEKSRDEDLVIPAQLAEDVGFPPGVLNVVTSSRDRAGHVGSAMCESPLVHSVSFTGSTSVGKVREPEACYTREAVYVSMMHTHTHTHTHTPTPTREHVHTHTHTHTHTNTHRLQPESM